MTDEKKIILVIGKRGSGKSYLVKQMIKAETRLVIYDIMSEYNDVVVFESERKEQLAWFWKKFYRTNFRIAYRPISPKTEIDWIAQLVYSLGDMTFVCEEIDSFCTTYDMPEIFSAIIQRGRHKNITLMGVTPAPFGINRDLTRQAKEIYIFNTNEPRDLQYISQLLGSETAKKIPQLDLYSYVKWSDNEGLVEIGRA